MRKFSNLLLSFLLLTTMVLISCGTAASQSSAMPPATPEAASTEAPPTLEPADAPKPGSEAEPAAVELGTFTICSTTDMHGRCWETNILNDKPSKNNMLRTSTTVKEVRAAHENVILVDNGDTYQGTPVSSYQLQKQAAGQTELQNPMATCLKEIGYDYSVLGNHEFNYPWRTMEEVRAYLADGSEGRHPVPTLCANLYYEKDDGAHAAGSNAFKPYDIRTLEIGGRELRIAIIGFVTPDCPRWDVPDNYPNIIFHHPDNPASSIAWEADRYVEKARGEGADFVIVSFHSGLGGDNPYPPEEIRFGVNSENQVHSMIRHTSGIDMVIAGHDHTDSYSGNKYLDKDGKAVLVVNSGTRNLTCSTFAVMSDGTVRLKEHKDLLIEKRGVDKELEEKIRPCVDLAMEYVQQPCGKIADGPWSTSRSFYLRQTDTIDLVNRAQIDRCGLYLARKYATEEEREALFAAVPGLDHLFVDCSASAVVVSSGFTVQPSDLFTMKDIYKLYIYDNTLYLLPLSGRQIKDILEFNAAERLGVRTGRGYPVYKTIGDSYTNPVFYGLDFQYDMAREPGERVVGLRFSDGRPLDLEKVYIMAVNNYHLGNGPFAAYSPDDAIWSQTDDLEGGVVQDLIAEFIQEETRRSGGVGVEPAPSGWSLAYSGPIEAPEVEGEDICVLSDRVVAKKKVVLRCLGSGSLPTNQLEGAKLAPSADVQTSGDLLGTSDGSAFLTLEKSGKNYLVRDGNGRYLTSAPTGNGVSLEEEKSPLSLWKFQKAGDCVWNICAVNAEGEDGKSQALVFQDGYTTRPLGKGDDNYAFSLYIVHENTERRGAKEATADEPGYTGDLYCLDCGELLSKGKAIPQTGV